MYLSQLSLLQVRNLQQAQLAFHPRANFIFGLNGAGKTSLLEAIYLLGRTRSFRSSDPKQSIAHDTPEMVVHGQLRSANNQPFEIGVKRERNGAVTARLNGDAASSAYQLMQALPVQLFYSDTFQLIEGSPSVRRSFLDWGVFHVEHDYQLALRGFYRVLKQRNELLRRGKMRDQLDVWDEQFCRFAESLHQYRSAYVKKLAAQVNRLVEQLPSAPLIDICYQSGWQDGHGLAELLLAHRDRDEQRGASQLGPHRADLVFRSEGRRVVESFSRGQLKRLCYILKLAQAQLLHQETEQQALFLLDDLPSELDEDNRRWVMAQVHSMGAQAFITGIERQDLSSAWPDSDFKVFHVERGVIEESPN